MPVTEATLAKLRRLRDLRTALAAHESELDADERWQRWRDDPLGFVEQGLAEPIWSKQREILAALRDHRMVAVVACHGVGKSHIASRAALWSIAAKPAGVGFLVTSAPTFQQVRAVLWRYLSEAHGRHRLPGRILGSVEWHRGRQLVGMGRKPADGNQAAFQGVHADEVTLVFDEADGIERGLWDAGLSLLTNDRCRWLAIGNPDDPSSEFAKVCQPGSGWHVIRISALDAPAFTGEAVPESLARLLVSRQWVEDARRRFGEGSPTYTSKVLGQWPETRDDALIAPAWISAAIRAYEDDAITAGEPVHLGVDVARYGSDMTVIALRRGGRCEIIEAYQGRETMETVGRVVRAIGVTRATAVKIDDAGLGGGVTDRLRELQREGALPAACRIIPINVGVAAKDAAQFANLRAELHWNLRELLREGQIAIPRHDQLAADLAAPRYWVDSRGRTVVEPKDDMKTRGIGSPDHADALMLALAPVRPVVLPAIHVL